MKVGQALPPANKHVFLCELRAWREICFFSASKRDWFKTEQ
jgi:hypothetical protein